MISKLVYAGALALSALIAAPQFASAQGTNIPGMGPGGALCDHNGDCRGGVLGSRSVNRRDMDASRNVDIDRRVVDVDRRDNAGRIRDRDDWRRREYRNDRRDWGGYRRSDRWDRDYDYYRYHRSGPSIYLDLGVPSYRYYEPRYVEPRYAPRRVIRMSEAHVNWCYNRYRSYRERDNTFNPGKGRPRQQCYSPYS